MDTSFQPSAHYAPRAGLSVRNVVGMCAAVIAAIAFSYFLIDRQIAEALKPHFNGIKFFGSLAETANLCTPVASLTLAIAAGRAAFRGWATPLERALIAGAAAVLVAGVLTFELKMAFGRTWPETWVNNNPSYFGSGVYGFFPFHGGQGYASFPSGHMTAISSFSVAAAMVWPRLRWLSMAAVLSIAAGLLGADHHWFSDILAGTAIGGLCAWMAFHLHRDATSGAASSPLPPRA